MTTEPQRYASAPASTPLTARTEGPPRLAVVTGAARGIGAATAVALAAENWELLLVDACRPQPGIDYPMPRPDDLLDLADRCRAAGALAVGTAVVDLGRPGSGAMLAGALGTRTPSALVAVAGAIAGGRAWETSDEVWQALLRTNLESTRQAIGVCVPRMVAVGAGRVVAVSSAAVLRATPMLAAYSAAKAAVQAYVRALAADLAGTGVTATVVAPGSTRGQMLAASAEIYSLADQDGFAAQQLLRRVLEPAEIAQAMRWLCSEAAAVTTGSVVRLDGGMTA